MTVKIIFAIRSLKHVKAKDIEMSGLLDDEKELDKGALRFEDKQI
jgi:hypothetical protein